MFKKDLRFKQILTILLGLSAFGFLMAEDSVIPFDEAHWILGKSRVVELQGRQALMGFATLKDVVIVNGVIEYDQYVTGGRSYPGVMFRSQPDGSWERFYIRPHRSGRIAPSLYRDVLQYLPAWNLMDSWQLYSGPGYTAGSVIPNDRWFHVKIEVSGARARIFIDNREEAELVVPHLRHGTSRGGIMLNGPADGSAYYSNFSVKTDITPDLGPLRRDNTVFGFIKSWELSQGMPMLDMDVLGEDLPIRPEKLRWQALQADDYGLVDVARIMGRSQQPDTVFLRTVLHAVKDEIHPYRFGYSDHAVIYLNGKKIFMGDSTYQGRDPSFLGIIGLNDTLCLPLKSGDNELVVMLSEIMGGWGFMMQDGTAEFRAEGVKRIWQTGKVLDIPESAAYDIRRHKIYVSNFDPVRPSQQKGLQTIRQFDLQGLDLGVLVDGLRNPTGLTVHKDRLFAVEAQSIVEIDIEKKQILNRLAIPTSLRLNDIVVDGQGTIYASDTQGGVIFRIVKGKVEPWLRGADVERPNGLAIRKGFLYYLNNGDGVLKSVDLKTKKIVHIADISGGIGDGLAALDDGSFLVSHNEGRLLKIRAGGEVKTLLDLTVQGIQIADFSMISERNVVVFPSFYDKCLLAESLPILD